MTVFSKQNFQIIVDGFLWTIIRDTLEYDIRKIYNKAEQTDKKKPKTAK